MWRVLWLLAVVVVLYATTWPWSDFQGHTHWHKVRWVPFSDRPLSWWDIVENVVLFLPFGFCVARIRARRMKSTLVIAALLATALSLSVEVFQSFGHTRIPSATDLCTNVLGAILGVAIAHVWGS